MEIFLVGGAVRDKLLNHPYHEKDWVVVGASPQELLSKGYQQVGKDFPVFLHPKTKEEYALARTERKSGNGYTGFTCFSDPDVTLEEDLQRRDLTINAIAEDDKGNLIDPYGGQQDLQDRILRHVSPAFVEDPLRVLRVARFAARYAHLGFVIASETQELLAQIVTQGEIRNLVSERVWQEFDKALGTSSPDIFISTLRDCGALAVLMPELDKLFGVPQTEKHHPEIDCGIHSLLSLQQATLLSSDRTVRFAALIHDLGKGLTRASILPKHIGHETAGLKSIKNLCQRLRAPKNHLHLALITGEFHTHCHRALELKPQTILKLFKACDAFRRGDRFEQFLLASEADSRGRTGFEKRLYPQSDFLRCCLKTCNQIDKKPLIEQGVTGPALGEAIQKLQVDAIKQFKLSYTGDSINQQTK